MIVENRLPVNEYPGDKPSFGIEDILIDEGLTLRHNCSFENIQDFLSQEIGYKLPGSPNPLSSFAKWQLVIPTKTDVAQLIFLGRINNDMDRISVRDAQATVYIHRCVPEGWIDGKPVGKYKPGWIELAGVFPDTNGDHRLVVLSFGAEPPDPYNLDLKSMWVSIHENELVDREKESDTIFGPVFNLPTVIPYPNTYSNKGIVTNGILDLVPDQRRVVYMNPHYGDIPDIRGIQIKRNGIVWEVGLNTEGTPKPWKISIPDSLEKYSPLLSEPKLNA